MDDLLWRRLCIGFLDIPLEQRERLVRSCTSIEKLKTSYPQLDNTVHEADSCMRWLDKNKDGNIWWYSSPSFPCFDGIENHLPYMLLVRGKIPSPDRRFISIVGTRKASYLGLNAAFELGLEAGFNGYGVVSGMAEGCDRAATYGCLYSQMPCCEVLGCGMDVDYPSMSENIKSRIVEEGGCIVSQFAPSMPPLKQNFLQRNVVIAALGLFTIVVQAPSKSGALHTAEFALQMGHDVVVSYAGTQDNSSSRGSLLLARDGCPVINHICELTDNFGVKAVAEDCGQYRFQDRHYILKKF